jgi:hypothetical protein
MNKSSWAPAAVLAVSVLCAAAPASAAAQDLPQGAAGAPLDVTAGECVQGGGMIIIIADGTAPGGFSKTCQGGTHDGETII